LPEGATAEDTAWARKSRPTNVCAHQPVGAGHRQPADIHCPAGLEKKAFSEAPLAGNRLEWAYSTDKATLGGYEFYRRPFTGTVDGVAVARGVFYYGNINGRHFRVVNVQLPGISDGIILLYKTLDTLGC
jgi:hypothetical protein